MFDIPYEQLESMATATSSYEYRVTDISTDCKSRISKQFHIPTVVLDAYLMTEGAYSGHIRDNTDGSWDVGPMQINSVNWKFFYEKFGILPIDIRYNGCVNLMCGAYLIRVHLDNAGKDKIEGWSAFYKVAANYHSKTAEYNEIYQEKWAVNFNKLLEVK